MPQMAKQKGEKMKRIAEGLDAKKFICSAFILMLLLFFSGKTEASRCLQNSYEDNIGKSKIVMGNCPDIPLVSLSVGKDKRKEFHEKVKNQILNQINVSDLAEKEAPASIRIFMDKAGNVKNVMSRGSSGNYQLDEALVKAAYEIGSFGEVPKSLIKEAKATGIIVEFQLNKDSLAQ